MKAEGFQSSVIASVPVVRQGRRWATLTVFAIMCVGSFIASLDVQIVSASMEEVGESLAASSDDMRWIKTSYLIGEIIVIPLAAWMSRVMSTRWLLTTSAIGFTFASMFCAMAWDIGSMIVFRFLQGIFIGVTIPLTFTACLVLFEGRRKAIAASCASIAAGLAPMLGPIIGGWISHNWSWQWVFYLNVIPGAVIGMLAPLLVRMDRPDLTLVKGADYLGMILLAVCFGCLTFVLEEGQRWEWMSDDGINMCSWIAALAGVCFIIRSLTYARPIVDLRAFTNLNYLLGCWFAFLTGVGIYGLIYLTPPFLGIVHGFVAWQIGGAMLSAGLFQIAAVPIYGFLVQRVDLRLLLMIGLTCFGICLWLFLPMMSEWGWGGLLPAWVFRGVGVPFAIASGLPLAVSELPPERLRLASGLFAVMRSLGGAIGVAICAIILNARTHLHFLEIAEHLNLSNTGVAHWLQGMSSDDSRTAALKKLWEVAYGEARFEAFGDAYFVIATCFVVSALMVPLLRAAPHK